MDLNLELLNAIDSFVWGPPLLVLLVGTGILLTLRLKLLQIFQLPKALGLIFKAQNKGNGDIDSFKALCTALSATVGTGNIVGVATAIAAGGPGAIFWMWMAAFFGMATKYAEGLLAVKYREVDSKGEIAGGPMFYIKNGMGPKFKWLGSLFAIFGVLVAYFGIGTFAQVNSIVDITKMTIGLDPMSARSHPDPSGCSHHLGRAAVYRIGRCKDRSGYGSDLLYFYYRCTCVFRRQGACSHSDHRVQCLLRKCSSRRFPGCDSDARDEKWYRQRRILQ